MLIQTPTTTSYFSNLKVARLSLLCLVPVHVWLSIHTSLYESRTYSFVSRFLYSHDSENVLCGSSSYCLDKVSYWFFEVYIHTQFLWMWFSFILRRLTMSNKHGYKYPVLIFFSTISSLHRYKQILLGYQARSRELDTKSSIDLQVSLRTPDPLPHELHVSSA